MTTGKKILSVAVSLTLLSSVSLACSQSNSTPAASSGNAQEAQKVNYPTKPIEMTIGFAAGGQADIGTRLVVNAANKHLPNAQTIVVSNKTGASGSIQLAEVFQAKPDGYKIGSVTTGNLIIQPNFGNTPYKSGDFEPISLLNSAPNMLVVQNDAPWKTFDEWLTYVKANPDKFTYGTAGSGDTKHVAMETLNVTFGVKTKQVGFDGSAQSITALLGGHVMGTIISPQEAKPHTDAGKLRVLANLGSTKTEFYPEAPFLKESGSGFPGFDTWTGILAPKNTPKEIITILDDAFKKAMQDQSVIDEFKKMGTVPTYAGPDDFKKVIEEASKTSAEIMKKAGLVK
ncbi:MULTISPECIES: tripartite tricarboxylate transporter substrate binding protein [unclassified Paenibacillus]|uniref:Bug family tripartite tricarboxylate transporter substrate binding protein n=1 Tax=unclassified Paenibacillus TaxID=185978 RepID=UPI001AE82FC5|nr:MULTISPECIES: tripartite tricarboxylate transporter substrate binding protein [unclassified Paenibacillus]MBP1154968.1 tripartite-type tricarboxylate transporter receptor subunit TctC [Paenibacillus sp. PvP091]MBP1169648.1 tripartite-type tricarboxylate transporter receptor subunit TctC [Paenibacillus sp. PvR098]MBP2440676.1 tripartite-type tricarboxylate transporter receptor subunit TctC [Paenibacillus sp. PvP052]